MISILKAVWEAADYPWSVRLKALLPEWMPWIRRRFRLTPQLERQLLQISAPSIDHRLRSEKRKLRRRIYGRTKPGTLLKHHILLKTDHWDVHVPASQKSTWSPSSDIASTPFVEFLAQFPGPPPLRTSIRSLPSNTVSGHIRTPLVISLITASNLDTMGHGAHAQIHNGPFARPCHGPNPLLGVCLVSISVGQERDLVGIERTNRMAPGLSIDPAAEAFR